MILLGLIRYRLGDVVQLLRYVMRIIYYSIRSAGFKGCYFFFFLKLLHHGHSRFCKGGILRGANFIRVIRGVRLNNNDLPSYHHVCSSLPLESSLGL